MPDPLAMDKKPKDEKFNWKEIATNLNHEDR